MRSPSECVVVTRRYGCYDGSGLERPPTPQRRHVGSCRSHRSARRVAHKSCQSLATNWPCRPTTATAPYGGQALPACPANPTGLGGGPCDAYSLSEASRGPLGLPTEPREKDDEPDTVIAAPLRGGSARRPALTSGGISGKIGRSIEAPRGLRRRRVRRVSRYSRGYQVARAHSHDCGRRAGFWLWSRGAIGGA